MGVEDDIYYNFQIAHIKNGKFMTLTHHFLVENLWQFFGGGFSPLQKAVQSGTIAMGGEK